MADLLDAIAGDIESSQTALFGIRTLHGISNEDTDSIDPRLTVLENQTSQANDEYTHIAANVENSVEYLDQFAGWIDAVSHLQMRICKITEGIRQFREPVQTSNITPSEERLLDVLNKLGGTMNLVRLRHQLEELSEEEFWILLRNVWEKQFIEVRLKIL